MEHPTLDLRQADDYPAVTEFRFGLAQILSNLNGPLSVSGKPSEAETEIRKAMALLDKLADDNPAVARFRMSLAQPRTLAYALSRRGKPTEAEAEFRAAVTILGEGRRRRPQGLVLPDVLAVASTSSAVFSSSSADRPRPLTPTDGPSLSLNS